VPRPEPQEHELIKLAALATALAGTLSERGISRLAACPTGQTGIAIVRAAFERWVNDTGQRGLPELIREPFDELKALTGGSARPPTAQRSSTLQQHRSESFSTSIICAVGEVDGVGVASALTAAIRWAAWHGWPGSRLSGA
jgi:hypothetical protein